jgi:hypothetical protein
MSQFFINVDLTTEKRFAMGKFFQFTDSYDPLSSFFMNEVVKLPQSGYYNIQGEEGRPDYLSYKIYGDTQYWWILLLYNNKLEFDDFSIGDIVRFPSTESIEDLFFSLKARENATNG